jgi:hypothetical protein
MNLKSRQCYWKAWSVMGNSSEVSAEEKPSEQILDGNEEPV